jgi:membrane-associated phospholipid phosphatase
MFAPGLITLAISYHFNILITEVKRKLGLSLSFHEGHHTMKQIFESKTNKFMGNVLTTFILCICLSARCSAGSDKNGVESLDGLVKHFYQDSKHVLTSPLHWKQNDLVLFTTLSISTLELMLLDRDSQKIIQRNRTSVTNRISNWTDRYTKWVANSTIGGLYLSGLVFHDQKFKETALLCLESVTLSGGITQSLKHLIGRSRPLGNKGSFNFDPLKFPPPFYSLSFPSGHATTAFALSSVIAEQYRSWVVKLISYSFASVASLGRVNNNFHFLSDVFWGGVIGTSVGRCLVKFHKEEDKKSNWGIISLRQVDNWGLGIVIWVR